MSVNHLNGAFNAQQARAIEKYVADFVAVVLKNAGEGNIEPGNYVVKDVLPKEPARAVKAAKVADVMIEGEDK
jgi:hypothetical protein